MQQVLSVFLAFTVVFAFAFAVGAITSFADSGVNSLKNGGFDSAFLKI